MEFSGLYLHVPFCKSKCYYCDFFSISRLDRRKELIRAMMLEIKSERFFVGSERPALRTIYFGGGTPSLLDKEDFENIFFTIEAHYDIRYCEEITLEANPDDLTPEYLKMLRGLPFNRISIGVQSFQEDELVAINRRHSAHQAVVAVENSHKYGFENIGIDLMYGLPGQTQESFMKSVDVAMDLPIKHLSSYALSWEEGSVLFEKREQGLLEEAEEELLEACYFDLIDRLATRHFVQYELSNFAQLGYESKHNSSYWNGATYLGIGPGAHSFNETVRRMNVSSVDQYIHGVENGKPVRKTEILRLETKYNDFIITHLRTMQGINLKRLELLFGKTMVHYCLKNAAKSISHGFLDMEDKCLRLSRKGYFIADSIFSDLLWVEDLPG